MAVSVLVVVVAVDVVLGIMSMAALIGIMVMIVVQAFNWRSALVLLCALLPQRANTQATADRRHFLHERRL